MRHTVILIASALLLSGCSKVKLDHVPDQQLCNEALHGGWVGQHEERRAELLERGLIEPYEWDFMKKGVIKAGMNRCAVSAIIQNQSLKCWTRYDLDDYGTPQGKKLICAEKDPRKWQGESPSLHDMFRHLMPDCRGFKGAMPPACQPKHIVTPSNRVYDYVPKFLIKLKDATVTDCLAVDLTKIGKGVPYRQMQSRSVDLDVFTLPCTKDVPGF